METLKWIYIGQTDNYKKLLSLRMPESPAKYVTEIRCYHMRNVLNIIINQSLSKFGMQYGRGKTYEAMLTVESIAIAQKYYEMILKIKEDKDELKICDEVKKALPDFPKVAITFSVSENEESSQENQNAMSRYLTY